MEPTIDSSVENPYKERVNEILTAYGLDFTIIKAPMETVLGDGNRLKTAYFGLVNGKTSETISTVKEGYGVSQNADIIEMVLRSIESFGDTLTVHKAGCLNGGRRVFVQLAIAGQTIVGEDIIKRYITIIDSNDKSYSLSVGVGDVTLSCMNQFAAFYSKGDKIRHSASLEQKLKELPSKITSALNVSMKQMDLYRQLAGVLVNQDLVHRMVKHVLGYDKGGLTSVEDMAKKTGKSIENMEKLYDHITKEMNQKGATLWGLHSGVTSYTTHELKKPSRENGADESLYVGRSYLMNQKSLKFVTDVLATAK